ncbi:mechanosensitive ion channel domain-containing protein [uncultured Thiodictyon sp.]|uniref:mechanosensitive ion channel domain-containing protein n=1 Tax=uncultured Thiodictyon sp. TaxID=1846217 RepID=UPI0025FDB858|nr:mechanosensitive ion channel domain-containing protein [uncultured Thiodictyon sp.]
MIRHLLLFFFLFGQAPLLFAQLSQLSQLSLLPAITESQPEVAAPLKDIKAERARVAAHIEEATKQLTEANQALAASDVQRNADDEQALQERVNLLQARVQVGRRHLKIVDEAQAVREEKTQLQEEFNSWTGFATPPPYPLDVVEALGRQLKARQAATQTDELRRSSFAYAQARTVAQLASDQKAFRQTLEALESAGTDEVKQDARKKHALRQIALSLSAEGVAFVQSSEQALTEKLGLDRLREEFIRKKLTVALPQVQLTPGEVQTKLDALGQELRGVNDDLTKTSAAEALASRQLESVRARLEGQKETGGVDPLLTLEQQLIQAQRDAVHATLDDVNLHIGYLQLQQIAWRDRLELHQHWDFAKARTQLADLAAVLPTLEQGIASLELARTASDGFEVEPRFAIAELAASRDALVSAMNERRVQLGQTLRSALQLRDFLTLWQDEIKVRVGETGAAAEARGWTDVVVEYLQRLWSFELLSIEDTLVVDGERVSEKRPVTIGKVSEALLILTVGLLLASGLARVISRILLPFGAEKWRRRLLIQKLLRVGMTLAVVVLALVTVKIPLAVFAFLGGAIALGIGFGAKNLLNNFISGFIILGEGTIRVGDRIEIEGTQGIVARIGERSTRVRRLDGVDMLIPNSHFLENRVTNMTLADQRARVTIAVGVAYGSPTRQVHALLLEIAKSHPLVVADPVPAVVFEDFGDSALIFRVYVWIDFGAQDDYRAVVTELRHTISERFAQEGHEIAFPQRDVHLDAKSPIRVQVLAQAESDQDDPACKT